MTTTRRELLGLLAVLPAAAADFWEKEPDFLKWSAKDIDKLLTNSPWAQKAFIALQGGGGAGGPGGGGGGRGGGGGFPGGGGGGGGRPGGGFPGGGGQMQGGPRAMEFMVRWFSAQPVKEAMIAAQLQNEGARLSDEMQAFLDRRETHYILTVSGFRGMMGQRFKENQERLAGFATLERKDKEAIGAEKAEARDQGNQAIDLAFYFPRTDPITEADKDVEFVFKPGGRRGEGGGQGAGPRLEIKRKFKLKDMFYEGELAI